MAIAKENKVVHGNDLTTLGQLIKAYAQPKENGKGLSENDYTDAEKQKLRGIEEGADVNVIEGIRVNGSEITPQSKVVILTIPVKVSDLTNDSGFIDNLVDNLVNYYKKNQVYSKEEVDSAISAAVSGEFVFSQSLPTASASTMSKIYFIPNGGSQDDTKDEYVTKRTGTEGAYTYSWERIGSTRIDLSNYVTNDQLVELTNQEVVTLLNLQ